MPLQRFATSRWYRSALHAALVAMLLLLVGPLISQLQAGHHHHQDGHHEHHHGDSVSHHEHSRQYAGPVTPSEPIFTWFHECGYCSLWQQFPSAHALLPAIARQAFIHHAPLPQMPQLGFASLDNYRHAPPRAPPAA
ncbi:DUF2946 family protein [Vreelandella sp. EE22]